MASKKMFSPGSVKGIVELCNEEEEGVKFTI